MPSLPGSHTTPRRPRRSTFTPIAIYTTMESDLGAARALAVSLMAVALLVFLVLRLSGATGGRGRR